MSADRSQPRSSAEAVVMGRVGADMYPLQSHTALKDVRDFRRFVGGFAANVATGLARLDVDVAIVSAVGSDGHGQFIREFLDGEGVDTTLLGTDDSWLTPLAFCELWPPDTFPMVIYRQPTAPDWELSLDDIAIAQAADVPLLIVSGTGLARPLARDLTRSAMRANHSTTLLDLDYRPALWSSAREYGEHAADAVADADIVIGNEAEVEAAGLSAEQVVADGKSLILKRGPAGVAVYSDDESVDLPGVPTDVVNGLGAGDAFAAAFGYGLLRGHSLGEAAARANLAGALVASRLACADAMPRIDELELEEGVSPMQSEGRQE